MCKFLITVFLLFFLIYGYETKPQLKPRNTKRIIFPTVNKTDDCFVDEHQSRKGTCKSLAACPRALERWSKQKLEPQTCYFNKSEHFVCCDSSSSDDEDKVFIIEPVEFAVPQTIVLKRRSDFECESYYQVRIQVVEGIPTVPREFPYMAALGWLPNFGSEVLYRCGGVLISNKYVLTAAHCSRLGGDWPVFVRLGGVNLTDTSVQDIGIKRVIVHPAYNDNSFQNDIALIELENRVREMPACVWHRNELEHNNVTAIGYGNTQFAGVSSNQLLKAPLSIVSNDECSKFYPFDGQEFSSGIEDNHICAGDPEHRRDTCQGDSGGPLIMKVEGDSTYSYVVGITSYGQGCAGVPPSIYTRTSAYIDWIEEIVWKSSP